MGEYALITATFALLAISVGTTTGTGDSRALPTTVPAARALVSATARMQGVSPGGARMALQAAPYRSVPLRTL